MFVNADGAGVERDQIAFPLQMSDFSFTVERRAPAQGEHSREILAEIGYDDERLASLEKSGVI